MFHPLSMNISVEHATIPSFHAFSQQPSIHVFPSSLLFICAHFNFLTSCFIFFLDNIIPFNFYVDMNLLLLHSLAIFFILSCLPYFLMHSGSLFAHISRCCFPCMSCLLTLLLFTSRFFTVGGHGIKGTVPFILIADAESSPTFGLSHTLFAVGTILRARGLCP